MTDSRRCLVVTDNADHGYSAALDELSEDGGVEIISGTDLAADTSMRVGLQDRLIITSENTLESTLRVLGSDPRAQTIRDLKDKHRCRELLQQDYPDFFFRRIPMEQVGSLELPPGRKFVIKPNRGYFATAVKIVDSSSDLTVVRHEIHNEIQANAAFFSNSVLSETEVIIEDYIDGDEYAVDMFYDSFGEPIIVNIYKHPIPKNPSYLHVLYYSDAKVFEELHNPIYLWLQSLNKLLGVTSFPMHAEFRIRDGFICPVELNPMRFAGDGLCDLALHAYGENPYVTYFEDRSPDWDRIWEARADTIFACVMGYNGTGVDVSNHRPDRRQFQGLFSNILSDKVLNYQHHLAFCVVYVEETSMESIDALVDTDFRELFLESKAWSESAFQTLYRAGVRTRFPADSDVWCVGDNGEHVILVLEGRLEIVGLTSTGNEFVLDSAGPRSVVGEYSALDGLPRSTTVRAREECIAVRIPGPAFRQLLRESPEIFEDLYWQQVERVRHLNHRIAELLSNA